MYTIGSIALGSGKVTGALGTMAILALTTLAACQETPSYRLRWSIAGRPMLDTVGCSESGLLQVRSRAYTTSGTYYERVFPCFPAAFDEPEGMVAGSELPPGRYAIELRGIDRAAGTWEQDVPSLEPNAPEPLGCRPGSSACRPDQLVCDCQELVVVESGASATVGMGGDMGVVVEEGDTVDLPTFVLMAPPECVDGIDNDKDGMVDGSDPSCNVDFGDGTESVPVGVTEFRLSLSLLGGNPAVSCAGVPLRRLQLRYEGTAGPEVVLEEPCRLDRPYVTSLVLPAGPITFSVVGLDNAGNEVTVVKPFGAQISPTGGTVVEQFDFGPSDFLEPITSAIRIRPGYVSELGTEARVRYSCEPPAVGPTGGPTRGYLQLDQLEVTLLNRHGGVLDTPVALEDGVVIDGPTRLDCRTELVTETLEWGTYRVVIEALSPEGEVCFSNAADPFFAPPGQLATMFMPRVYLDREIIDMADAGSCQEQACVPVSCRECVTDDDCGLVGALACRGNVCQSVCSTDADCVSDEVGDTGAVCVEGIPFGHCGQPPAAQ